MITKKSIVIIKIGTNVLTTDEEQLDLNVLRHLVDQISVEHVKQKSQFVIVTSGAITCGAKPLGVKPSNIPQKQAAAAIGQILLMREYAHFFSQHGIHIAQILLTKDCITEPIKKQNTQNTLFTLFEQGIIPIINENDTVATEEIGEKFGDNDELSCGVAQLVDASLLITLSDIEGLFTANPKADASAVLIDRLASVSDETLKLVNDIPNGKSRGGMTSKLLCAKKASDSGIAVVLAKGKRLNVISDILSGNSVGTRIDAQKGLSHV